MPASVPLHHEGDSGDDGDVDDDYDDDDVDDDDDDDAGSEHVFGFVETVETSPQQAMTMNRSPTRAPLSVQANFAHLMWACWVPTSTTQGCIAGV